MFNNFNFRSFISYYIIQNKYIKLFELFRDNLTLNKKLTFLNYSKILKRTKNFISPWVSIYEDNVLDVNGKEDLYHAILVHDYVCIIAIEVKVMFHWLPRHAVNELNLELPAGLCDNGQNPKEVQKRINGRIRFFSNSDLKELLRLDHVLED